MTQNGRSAGYVALHENVRLMVTELLKQLYLEIIRKRASLTGKKEYDLLEQMFKTPEFIPLIMPQEIYAVDGSRMRVDMAFGREIAFELKSDLNEFDEAYHVALTKYLPSHYLKTAKYFIITNYDYWRIYKINRGDTKTKIELEPIAVNIPKNKAASILRTQILPVVEPRLPAHPDVISKLFKVEVDKLITNIREAFANVKEDDRVKPLYEAYRKIVQVLYGGASEEFFEELYAKHTLMHMIVLASLSKALDKEGFPVDACSGLLIDVDVALPYLNWWRIFYVDPRYRDLRDRIQEIVEEVVLRVNLIDWSYVEAEDVFRELYELLVNPSTRRKLGEYYTPLWIVEYILNKFELRNRVVLDPFCGSGTFLVMAFHKKVDEGEDIDNAYFSVIGFDVNPLAVAIARAELIFAYLRRKGDVPRLPPHVYHTDTLAAYFGGEAIGVPEVEELFRSAHDYLALLVNFNIVKLSSALEILDAFSEIEDGLSKALRYAYYECKFDKKCLTERINYYLYELLKGARTQLAMIFLEHIKKNNLSEKLAQMIIKYSGNSVWGLVLVSIYVPIVLPRLRVDIIVTNPPWIPTTEFRALYADKLRQYLSTIIEKNLPQVSKKRAQIVAGSDIATAALAKIINMAKESVAFVMNREQSFYHRNPMPAGIIATYAVLKSWSGELELVDIDFDAFQHGIYPALVIAIRKNGGRKL